MSKRSKRKNGGRGHLAVRVGSPQVGQFQNNHSDRTCTWFLQENSTGQSGELQTLRGNASEEPIMKYTVEQLLAMLPEFSGSGQGSIRSALGFIMAAKGVPYYNTTVWCMDDMDNIKQLITEFSKGQVKIISQCSTKVAEALKDVKIQNEYDPEPFPFYEGITEGCLVLRDDTFCYIQRTGPHTWTAQFDFLYSDLSDDEVALFKQYQDRERAKIDPTEYQHIWMFVDYGNDLNFHCNKVELSSFKQENYSPENVSWLPRLKEAMFSPTKTGRLSILQGPPGTGKTRYLRALMQELGTNVCPVILPVSLAHELSSPRMLGVITGNSDFTDKKIMLIIEDGDQLLEKRERSNSVISDFLNIIDGLIGEVINLHVVVTTNLKKADFDPAITRPGRLHSIMYFENLPAAQSAVVYKRETNEDMEVSQDSYSLAEIYAAVNDHHNGVRKKPVNPTGTYL